MQLILTLSHGQVTVERGFSVNKEVLAPNLQETSLVAMRLVHSSMQAAKCKVAEFVVNDALLSCAHARNRYQMYLMERKAEQERTEKEQKRKALMEELTSAKKAKEDVEKVSKKLVNPLPFMGMLQHIEGCHS